jgi:hypothetical protein
VTEGAAEKKKKKTPDVALGAGEAREGLLARMLRCRQVCSKLCAPTWWGGRMDLVFCVDFSSSVCHQRHGSILVAASTRGSFSSKRQCGTACVTGLKSLVWHAWICVMKPVYRICMHQFKMRITDIQRKKLIARLG